MADQIRVNQRENLGLAIIQARKGVDAAAIGAALGVKMPKCPGRSGDARLSIIGTGPGAWFLVADDSSDDWAELLEKQLAGLASVFDQSSGYKVLRVSGSSARRLLQAGASLDLAPVRFGAGDAASTMIGHINVLFWQSENEQCFDIAFYRSYAASLHHWIDMNAAAL